jgi:hypothetical protein
VYLPTSVLLRLNAPSSNNPFWYRFHGNPERLQLHLGAGIKIVEWLKVGLGLEVLADLIGDEANVGVDLFSKQVKRGDINASLATRVGPVFSLHVSPIKRLRIGATFRWEMRLNYQIPAKVDLEGIGTLGFVINGVAHFTPHTLAFGAAFDVLENLTIALDGEWQNWSNAPSPYVGITIDLSGATLEALGLGSALDVTSAKQRPGFSDTFGGRLGAEYRISERFAARLGSFVRPTPVPKQAKACPSVNASSSARFRERFWVTRGGASRRAPSRGTSSAASHRTPSDWLSSCAEKNPAWPLRTEIISRSPM